MNLPRKHPVYLLGAGPGDIDLITVRGRNLLAQADIIIYDYLANGVLLQLAKETTRTIFVGKKGFCAHVSQEEINECLIREAQENPDALIVRCKGGDPFVFGRGGEEALALHEAGIPFEVVPGITAGVAACAYAGIPVTHRKVASSVTFVTGHETPEKNESTINWSGLALGSDTICFYMGIRNLRMIATKLIDAGKPKDTPAALVRWGTLPSQEVLTSTLENIASDAEAAHFQAPAIIVVGNVVNLRDTLSWFENRPLFGKRIVVTRSTSQASSTVAQLSEMGADVFECPTIAFESLCKTPEVSQTIQNLNSYDWIVFTSVNGVNAFFEALDSAQLDARACGSNRLCAIGPATAAALEKHGLRADIMPATYVAEEVARALIDAGVSGSRILIARAETAREVLPQLLNEAGATVDVIPFYRCVAPPTSLGESLAEQLQNDAIDGITFTSSSTVSHCVDLLSSATGSTDTALELLNKTRLYSIGPITSKTLEQYHLTPTATATEYTVDGLLATLRKDLEA